MSEHICRGRIIGPRADQARRTLVVDDEPLIGLSLKDCLERAGSDVVWADSDRAAHAALDEQPFDALIQDVDLGHGTTGYDVARYARTRFPDIGVIFSSGSPPDWLASFGVDGAVFVPKPCTEAAILQALERVQAE